MLGLLQNDQADTRSMIVEIAARDYLRPNFSKTLAAIATVLSSTPLLIVMDSLRWSCALHLGLLSWGEIEEVRSSLWCI